MQKQKLENLIKNFSLEKLNEFLFEINLEKDMDNLSEFNTEEDIFSEVQKLGEIKTEDDNKKIVVATAKVGAQNFAPLSERSSRKKQYDLGKKTLTGQNNYDAGIFVFYDKHGSFRFSLIYPTYSGTKRVLNSFKRFTYFVSKEQTNKTFLSQIGNGDFSSLEKIKDAFSVEKVTKEFFKEYKNLFEDLVKDLNKNHTFKNEAVKYNINTENFAKKLLGQIVFLCFLQKKCWLGASQNKSLKEGDENFLQNLFEKKYIKYGNFFNDVLEYLFYGALNKKSDKAGTFYRDYFKCQIPFLNGGLFDPEYEWQKTSIYLDDKIFKRILEVFNQYNFTVDENNPIDQEIAIDPEMLGKVFENLLNENLRKGKGTYYTPREIVHYMCQESLINYIFNVVGADLCVCPENTPKQKDITTLIKHNETKDDSKLPETISKNAKLIDEKLASIKVCDPACGSGAFLVGMLQEIIKAHQALQEFTGGQTSEYDLKKETIQNCIYGVDIDPGAIEIAKLRLWLSLVVDYELEEIEPLPNLDYKIMQGNSLLEELVLGDTSIKLFDQEQNKPQTTLLENEEQASIDKLNSLHKKYFALNDLDEKKKIKKEIDDIEYEVIKKNVEKEVKKLESDNKKFEFVTMGGMKKKDAESFAKNLSKQGQIMNVLDEFKKTGVKPFFLWRLYFADVFEKRGFDVVIANPPYVSAWSMEKENQSIRSEIKNALKNYSILTGHWDLYIAFIAKGHQLLKSYGSLSYIVPNPILKEKYATETRRFFLEDMQLKSILEFSDINVFENVARRTTVLVAVKNENKDNYQICILGNKNQNAINLLNKIKKESWLNQPKHIFSIKGNVQEDCLVDKIESQSERIGNFFYVNYGAQVSSKEKGKFGKKEVVGKKQKGNAKQFYEGKDVQRWCLNYRGLWLDYRIDKLYGPRTAELFEQSKIVVRKVSNKNHNLSATLDETKKYTDDGNVLLVPYKTLGKTSLKTDFNNYKILGGDLDLKYALAIILSKLESFYFRKRFATESLQGSSSHTYPSSVRGLLIKKISSAKQKPFINLVDQILEKKKDNPSADVGELEGEIDGMVYEMYGLGEEEIGIVESSSKK